MKKLAVILASLTILLSGCTSSSSSTTAAENTVVESGKEVTASPESETFSEVKSIDKASEGLTSIKITDTVISEAIGDKNANDEKVEDGDYFTIKGELVKCSDYENIHVVAELTNHRAVPLKTSTMAWSIALGDGTRLDIVDTLESREEIEAGETIVMAFDILKEKALKEDKLILSYWDVDFGNTFGELITKASNGVSQEECEKEYPEYFDESRHYTFEVSLK